MSRLRPILVAGFCTACIAWFVCFETTYALDRRLSTDEHQYFSAAALVTEGKLPYGDFAFNQAPVMPFVYGAVFRVTGARLLVARLLSVGFAVTSVLLAAVSLWSEKGRDERRPTAAAFLVASATGVQVFVSGVSLAHNASLGMFFVALGFLMMPERESGGRWRWLAAGSAAGLAVATRVLFVAAPLVFLLYALTISRKERWRNAVVVCTGCLLGVSPLIAMLAVNPTRCWACVVSMHHVVAELGTQPTGIGERIDFLREYIGKDVMFGLNFLFIIAFAVLPLARACLSGPRVANKDLLATAMTAALALTIFGIPLRYPHYFAIIVPFQLYAVFALVSWAWRRCARRIGVEFVLLLPLLAFLGCGQLWTISFVRQHGFFANRGVNEVEADARRLRGLLEGDAVVYTLAPCVVIEANLDFDPRLAPGRVWYRYAASGRADPCMLKVLRTPQDLDRLFRSGIPDAALVTAESSSFRTMIDRHYVRVPGLTNGMLYVRPAGKSAGPDDLIR